MYKSMVWIRVAISMTAFAVSSCSPVSQFQGKGAASTRNAAPDEEAKPVEVIHPERRELSRDLEMAGSVEAFEQVTLYAKAAGYLQSIRVDIGDRVRKGEVLARIDVPEMQSEYAAAKAGVKRAEARRTNAEAELVRYKAEVDLKKLTYERLRSVREKDPDVIPQHNVDEARAEFEVARSLVSLAESKIQVAQSELAGAEADLERLTVDPGALIQHALSQTNVSPIATVARVDRLRIFVDVPEPDVSFIRVGTPAIVELDALAGKYFQGTCSRFTHALDPRTRTMKTEIDVPNREGLLKPGMFGKVRLVLENRTNAVTVPPEALLQEDGKSYVFTVVGGRARRLEVKTGMDDGLRVEIREGLDGNESIILGGRNTLLEGAPVRISQSP